MNQILWLPRLDPIVPLLPARVDVENLPAGSHLAESFLPTLCRARRSSAPNVHLQPFSLKTKSRQHIPQKAVNISLTWGSPATSKAPIIVVERSCLITPGSWRPVKCLISLPTLNPTMISSRAVPDTAQKIKTRVCKKLSIKRARLKAWLSFVLYSHPDYYGFIASISNSRPIHSASRALSSSSNTTTTSGVACQFGGVPPINHVTGDSSPSARAVCAQ